MIKKFKRMNRPERIVIIFGIVIAVLYVIILVNSFGTILAYGTYDTQASARVYDVESRDTYVKCIKMTNYRARYAYEYAGNTYTGQTGSVDTKLRDGESVPVRFNRDDPSKALLEAERNDAVSFAIAGSVVTGIAVIWYFMNGMRPHRKHRR